MLCILNDLVAAGQITEAQADECRAARGPHRANVPIVSAKVEKRAAKVEKRAAKVAAWFDYSALRASLDAPMEDSSG